MGVGAPDAEGPISKHARGGEGGLHIEANDPLLQRDLPFRGGFLRPIRIIRTGGSATTFEARWGRGQPRGLPARVAVKVYKDWILREQGGLDRIRREASILTSIRHPNIVRVFGVLFDASRDSTIVATVMELLDGQTLSDFIREHDPGTIDVPRIRQVTIDLLDALAELESHGERQLKPHAPMVHRDIKPDNIIVSGEAGAIHPTLLDFGVLKILDAPPLTEEGAFLGTVRYASPLWIHGKSNHFGVDLYSLGLTIHEMMSGRPPYDGIRNHKDLMDAIEALSAVGEPTPLPEQLRTRAEEEREFLRCISAWLAARPPSAQPTSASVVLKAVKRGTSGQWWYDRLTSPEYIESAVSLVDASHSVSEERMLALERSAFSLSRDELKRLEQIATASGPLSVSSRGRVARARLDRRLEDRGLIGSTSRVGRQPVPARLTESGKVLGLALHPSRFATP